MKARPTQSRRGVKGGTSSLFVCPLQGQGGTSSLFVCPLWGLGQRPNCFAGDQHLKRTQQRRRQRSVPAPNFARPQTRPQAALPQDSVKNHKIAKFRGCSQMHPRIFLLLISLYSDDLPDNILPRLAFTLQHNRRVPAERAVFSAHSPVFYTIFK